jgi:conjugal transfer pilus assembly protein TraB
MQGVGDDSGSGTNLEFVETTTPTPNSLTGAATGGGGVGPGKNAHGNIPLAPIPLTPAKEPRFRSKGIQRTSLMLLNSKSHKNLKTFDNTIPAGAFAGAVMVGGVDASTSIQASNDPRPVLLRVTDHGTLPRKFKSDLCGCHVLAACYGDISSERVYMRLEKLTCTERKTGEVVEMAVNGYVAGEDGRAGLRGAVVDRAGESMRNAAIGGFLSGMGSFLSQSHSPVTFSPTNGLAQTNPMTNPEMLKFGAAKGATGALEKYADFYIKRAEQMQPVIQVQAGRKVDIVFTQGVAFESSAARGEMIRVNDQQRLSQLHNANDSTTKPVEAWIPNQTSSQEHGK